MNHRRGQRWQTSLKIRITCGEEMQPYPARLTNLSYNGAGLQLSSLNLKIGKMVEVQFEGMTASTTALVVHAQGGAAGVLWVEHKPWIKHLLEEINNHQEEPQSYSNAALG